LKFDDFGATLGGPILKDKLHVFLSWEKNKDDKSSVRSGFVPTVAERAGDFSGARLAGCTPQIPVDPLTGQPFPGNVIPANRLNQNIGSKMTNALTYSYSANKITATRTGDSSLVDQINSLIPTLYPSSIKERAGVSQPLFWGAGPYGSLWNQAPWLNNQDLN